MNIVVKKTFAYATYRTYKQTRKRTKLLSYIRYLPLEFRLLEKILEDSKKHEVPVLVNLQMRPCSIYHIFFLNKSGLFKIQKEHLGSLTAANWVSFDFNVAYSSC